MKPSSILDANREFIRELTAKHGLLNPRVFGSVARGEDGEDSDLDILVDTSPATTYFDLARLLNALELGLRNKVHLVPAGGLKGTIREIVMREARPI
jgi:uncharacterized protein